MFKKLTAFLLCFVVVLSVSAALLASGEEAKETSEKETNWVEVVDPTYPIDDTTTTTRFSDEEIESYSQIGDDLREDIGKGFNFFEKINQIMQEVIDFFNGLFERLKNVDFRRFEK